MKIRQVLLWGIFLLIMVASIRLIQQKENILAHGQVIYLELQPVDPRSLIQGDYMNLRYSIANDIAVNDYSKKGLIVASLDGDSIARFARIHDPNRPLEGGEIFIQYYSRGTRAYIGPNAFFFQEGDAQYYDDANYGELRVSDDGESILVGLRGEGLEMLGPPGN